MRVTSSFWVSAFMRRAANEGAFPVVEHKGADEAGAIFIRIDTGLRSAKLFTPAPMLSYDADVSERKFEAYQGGEDLSSEVITARLARELKIDSDIWIIAVDDREGRSFLDDSLIQL